MSYIDYIDLFVNVLSLLGIAYNIWLNCLNDCRQDPHRKPQEILIDEIHSKVEFIHLHTVEQDALRRNSH
jgi:hypothetical protein